MASVSPHEVAGRLRRCWTRLLGVTSGDYRVRFAQPQLPTCSEWMELNLAVQDDEAVSAVGGVES